MVTARKISLLCGVLHLNEDAVADVLAHMELVKSLRRRIQDTLTSTKIIDFEPDPKAAAELLEKAATAEVAVLRALAARPKQQRIQAAEMHAMVAEKGDAMRLKAAELSAFLDREAFAAYELLDQNRKATAQTATTLVITEGTDPSQDTITVWEFSAFVLRFVADVVDECLARSPEPGLVKKFWGDVVELDSVDDTMIEIATQLTRTKALFRATDADHSGLISRKELFTALRRYKVPISYKEFRQVFRVIDPDQTYTLRMEEWVDFMTVTDISLDKQTSSAQTAAKPGEAGRSRAKTGAFGRGVFVQQESAEVEDLDTADAANSEQPTAAEPVLAQQQVSTTETQLKP